MKHKLSRFVPQTPSGVLVTLLFLLSAAALGFALFQAPTRVDLTGLLRQPAVDVPSIVIETSAGEFPDSLLSILVGSHASPPHGDEPAVVAMPLFAAASHSAVTVELRDTGLAMNGIIELERREERLLSAGKVPAGWSKFFTEARIARRPGEILELNAANLPTPIYIDLEGRRACLADSLTDIDEMREVRSGKQPAMKDPWRIRRQWGGHALISDSGLLASSLGDDGPGAPLRIEVAWNKNRKEAQWKVSGLERLGISSPATYNWGKQLPIAPQELIASVGINLPSHGRSIAKMAPWLGKFASTLVSLGLKESEALAALTGPFSLSLGGNTQILWFELPGVVLDVPGRGRVANKIIDLFWTQVFLGIEPRPIDGFNRGGLTDLPFSVIAAANSNRMVFALSDQADVHNERLNGLLSSMGKAVAWFYVDLPELGKSLSDMPSVGEILASEDEVSGPDPVLLGTLSESLASMGQVFIVWKDASGGTASW